MRMGLWRCWFGWAAAALCLAAAHAQTTQGVIFGHVSDQQTGDAIASAKVTFFHRETDTSATAQSDASGNFAAPLLPPGTYRVRTEREGYQPQEVQGQELRVASTLEVNFEMRPARDVFGSETNRISVLSGGRMVHFFGPDVETRKVSKVDLVESRSTTLQSTLSYVVDPRAVEELPFAGRDVYAALVLEPGVTSDATTSRGLGLAINGQRPSASNFLLDGLENNNYLITGPLGAVAPEAVQEYRVSTNNFSAEYGRTAGYVANAVTRSGGNQWHGLAYMYAKNDWLNANDFQRNRAGLERAPLKESEAGFSAGGPVIRGRLFTSISSEYLRFRTRSEPASYTVPTPAILVFTSPAGPARRLLTRFAPPPVTNPTGALTADVVLAPPSSLNRYTALPRVDYVSQGGVHRLLARVAASGVDRPDFLWTPYKEFVTPLRQNTLSLALAGTSTVRTYVTNEVRFGWSTDDLRFDRRWPDVPTLASEDNTTLPGSPLFYSFRNRSRSLELVDNVVWVHARHIAKFGGEFLTRHLDGYLTAGRDPYYLFQTALDFALGFVKLVQISVQRSAPAEILRPDFNRSYRYNQFFLFAEDSFRMTPRLVLNYGLRYEGFGAPRNVGPVKDAVVKLGEGDSLPQRIQRATLAIPSGGDQSLYDADHNDVAIRAGFAYRLTSSGRTSVRGAYGIFYDRPFDNLWQNLRNNNFTVAPLSFAPARQTDFLQPGGNLLQELRGVTYSTNYPALTMYQPHLRTGYAQSYFFGVQHQVTDAFTIEINGAGSLGRKLITSDIVNRPQRSGGYNSGLPLIAYRANQGLSGYRAFSAVARYRVSALQFQAAYTLSHTVDNQSDPLSGQSFNLAFTQITSPETRGVAAFSREFDSRGDRGDSDFDQTHNLVFYGIWDLPVWPKTKLFAALSRGWRIAALGALRSGFPYTVQAPSSVGEEFIENNRANLLDPAHAQQEVPAAGGKQLLNKAAFAEPAAGKLGNSLRNQFRGPGLVSADISVSRSFAVKWLGETGRLTLRADAFNAFNHANLNNPDALVGSETFGVATFGRVGRTTGFPAVSPFRETARQIQLLIRVGF
jgi:hypothetical protein